MPAPSPADPGPMPDRLSPAPSPSPCCLAWLRRHAAGLARARSASALAAVYDHHISLAVARRALAGHPAAVRQVRVDLAAVAAAAPGPEPEPELTWAPGEGAAAMVREMHRLGCATPPGISSEPYPNPWWERPGASEDPARTRWPGPAPPWVPAIPPDPASPPALP